MNTEERYALWNMVSEDESIHLGKCSLPYFNPFDVKNNLYEEHREIVKQMEVLVNRGRGNVYNKFKNKKR